MLLALLLATTAATDPICSNRMELGGVGSASEDLARVQELAPFDQQRVVGHLLRQRMLEDVFDVADRRLLVDELRHLQVAEHPL